jgi:hypothetical protein
VSEDDGKVDLVPVESKISVRFVNDPQGVPAQVAFITQPPTAIIPFEPHEARKIAKMLNRAADMVDSAKRDARNNPKPEPN